jgi:hypothetical protein
MFTEAQLSTCKTPEIHGNSWEMMVLVDFSWRSVSLLEGNLGAAEIQYWLRWRKNELFKSNHFFWSEMWAGREAILYNVYWCTHYRMASQNLLETIIIYSGL